MPPTVRFRLLALAFALAASAIAQAQEASLTAAPKRNPGPIVERVHVGFEASYPGRYSVGRWTPVFVDLATDTPPFRGQIEVVTPDDDGVPTIVRYPADLLNTEKRTFVANVRPGTLTADLTVRLLDARGQPVPNLRPVRLAPFPVEAGSHLVLVAGEPSGVNLLAGLARFQTGIGRTPELIVANLRDFPSDATSFDGVEVVVLQTDDEQVVKWLETGADRVLRDWVEQGGHLVVALGANWQDDAVRRLDPMLPARPAGSPVATDPQSLESFTGGVSKPIRGQLNVVPLEGWTERGGVPIAASAITPLVVRGAFGLGRVTLTGVDVAHAPFSSWDDRVQFWDRVLELHGRIAESAGLTMSGRGSLIQSAAPELAARLHRSLESFPGVRIVPFGWVAFFVFAYIVLIGPLDYLFLRKVVKRMELTWITFPLIVLVVSLLAYFGAYAYKGSDLRVNKVDLLDFDQTSGVVRGHTWLTVFSPVNHDYGLAIHPRDPDFEAGTAEAELRSQTLSWFASPEPVLGGAGRIALGQSAYRYEPLGDPRALSGVRVAIWSTKSFTGAWASRFDRPVVEPRLQPASGDRVSGSIRNTLGQTLTNARLFYGRNVYDLGTIRPGGIARVDPTRTQAISAYLIGTAEGFHANANPYGQIYGVEADPTERRAVDSRTEILRVALFHDAMGNRADQFPSQALQPLDLSAQVADLDRPMLVAEVAAPAATLELTDAPATPQVDQSTLLRVVLPMGGEPEDEP